MDISIEVTSGTANTPVPEDVATDLAEVYATLKDLPVNRQATVDFTSDGYAGPAKIDGKNVTDAAKAAWNARLFVRQGKSWANAQGLTFARKGNVKDNPSRVSFRIYVPRATEGE